MKQVVTCCTQVSCLAYSSALNMQATCSSETSVDFQRTIRRYIPEDRQVELRSIRGSSAAVPTLALADIRHLLTRQLVTGHSVLVQAGLDVSVSAPASTASVGGRCACLFQQTQCRFAAPRTLLDTSYRIVPYTHIHILYSAGISTLK
jgi:hypothetical protein